MTPPKVLELHDVAGAGTPGARAAHAGYGERCRSLASVAGIVNAAHGSLVDLTVEVLAEGDHVGPGIHSPAQFLAWRIGCSKATANQLVAVAKRVDELPCLLGALRAGEISLDQAAVVARNVPARFDRSATDLARSATVEQLKAVLPAYRHDDETPEERAAREKRAAARRERSAGLFHDEDGGGRLTVHLDPAQTAAIEAAIAATRDDLFRQRQADATAAGTPDAKVEAPTLAETATALAASALAHGAAEHPGADRYLITYHLGAGPDGGPCLTDEHGRVVPASERRRLLCDHRFEVLLHGADGTPLSVGRATRHIGRKLRRAVLHRHGGRCAVPGCDASRGLEVHHIVHWEDGGPTDAANLLPLCHRHHAAHHDGLLDISGDAGLAPGAPGCVAIRVGGQALDALGQPLPVVGPLPDAMRQRTGRQPGVASHPTGERLDRRGFHLSPAPSAAGPPSARCG
ncbi:MAG TPA: DUF222 domain-containing protein [Aquihabitans sp.]|mgnify:CR=1 FL=1|nr:DUF222 domain-containing protein [Aquihabitans sp.]